MQQLLKKSLFGLGLLSLVQTAMADVQAVAELQKRLELVNQYSADFDQTVRSSKGKEIQKGKGTFQVKRPNLFRMDTKIPQENTIISDGKTLWFYDPFVAQVTANWVSDAVNNTPFVLLTSNNKDHWDRYDVQQNIDSFTLKPKSKKSGIKQFDVRIDSNGLMKGFSTIERDGQSNLYVLRNISTASIANDLFKFNVPKGVELDDQRTKTNKK
ncbi:outer-membrane lipoprotein carrier protein LolA [Vespertiliibacter pulmonis]|uniref:Outer-membrane lipoprotein carrier protein n=1 Tax=Vespertiliibacter pulmonis TaxID=1443036 RepID=A0A3N4VWX6_9PAST|nr:outer membrane lipoprotein chaperone LolA [Vespertiliibacter pulmonis]QLB21507.1 outer-membrane lipoprotein carrier protein LolA [Vespertiliibacter pulmonis]RPE85923.1 outer membrane lipoprotein carrier protein [Vespertiliibacter pulmonis]